MATGTYKSGVAIIVVYQAVNSATGKTIAMDVYDETHAKDDVKCVAEMTEIVYNATPTGRYYATFTPDAEGEWIVIMKNTTDGNGEVVKAFAVAGHDVDSIGDAVATLAGYIPGAVATEAKQDIIDTNVDDIETLVTTIEGRVTADVATEAKQDIIDTEVGNLATAVGVVDGNVDDIETLVTAADGKLDTIDGEIATIDSEVGAIKTVVDALGSPAMVG